MAITVPIKQTIAGVVPIFDPLPNDYPSRWNRYMIA